MQEGNKLLINCSLVFKLVVPGTRISTVSVVRMRGPKEKVREAEEQRAKILHFMVERELCIEEKCCTMKFTS